MKNFKDERTASSILICPLPSSAVHIFCICFVMNPYITYFLQCHSGFVLFSFGFCNRDPRPKVQS